MNANHRLESRLTERRGVVLILVLGMLALLALIGVTFATFASQSKISARNFAQSVSLPQSDDLFDFALSQLIGDTNDQNSAIRGHSLARDMYGNDGNHNGLVTASNSGQLQVIAAQSVVVGPTTYYDIHTNIAANDANLSGLDFTRWSLRLTFIPNTTYSPPTGSDPHAFVDQSFDIILDNAQNDTTSPYKNATERVFRVNAPDAITQLKNPTVGALASLNPNNWFSALVDPTMPYASLGTYSFVLDSRSLNAFNGPGAGNNAVNANFRYNGIDPNGTSTNNMDEDYDACDLENWFLAIQSADGQVIIPSFHRPAALQYWTDSMGNIVSDWNNTNTAINGLPLMANSRNRILRPRMADGHDTTSFPDLVPQSDGTIKYDVDNDADGLNDSVWVDLGYPPQRNAQGKLFKPLFAFMVIGLNGRIPLNSAGNLAGRDATTGVQDSSHASHLGNSVSEVDPTYALQNAIVDSQGNTLLQVDNAGKDVRTTQLWNLLTGTRPLSNTAALTQDPYNGDINSVQVDTLLDSSGTAYPVNYYLPNNIDDRATNTYEQFTPSGQSIIRLNNPVPGRWGEAESIPGPLGNSIGTNFNNPARAGYSLGNADADDDNFNAFDPYPFQPTVHTGEVGDQDDYDAVGALIFPVERIRRFVTPIDIDGSGRVVQWPNAGPFGGDLYGRVSFLSYFRPAGLPGIIDYSPANSTTTLGAIGTLSGVPALNRVKGNLAMDTTNNLLHGYDFYRFPMRANASPNSQRLGGMPANVTLDPSNNPIVPNPAPTTDTGQKVPTYDSIVNGDQHTDGQNDADEMNLYAANRYDDPFGAGDLEWLYRYQDVDGSSLSSRLSQLAPISFVAARDSLRRRRLFSIDSWETNNYSWVTDNPRGLFPNNSRFQPGATAKFQNLNSTSASPLITNQNFVIASGTPVSPQVLSTNPVPAPALAQHGKKINLNYPLPVSNDPNELVRQKWIRETYQTLKMVLPPYALDTPEELAQLSQFVVNIIDFRDPDSTITRFVNTDITLNLPAASTISPKLSFTTVAPTLHPPFSTLFDTTSPYLIQYGMEYNPVAINEILAYSYLYNKASNDTTLTPGRSNRFFVELVNTLTDSAATDATGTISSSRLQLGGIGHSTADPYVNGSWDLVFTNDDSMSRPDPFTGQLLNNSLAQYFAPTPLNQDAFNDGVAQPLTLSPLGAAGPIVPAAVTPLTPNYYCVIGNQDLAGHESAPPTTSQTVPVVPAPTVSRLLTTDYDPLGSGNPAVNLYPGVFPQIPWDSSNTATTAPAKPASMTAANPNLLQWKIPPLFTPTIAAGATYNPTDTSTNPKFLYYWACLRRPANPFAPVSAYNPMIVVDAVRFPYVDITGPIAVPAVPPSTDYKVPQVLTGNVAYSIQRSQPYRGGHAVPLPESNALKDWRYGYTEQMALPVNSGNFAKFDNSGHQASNTIYHSLGQGAASAEPWNYFPFNDRDFTSVAELMLVPGCSPGLFTKQFVEFAATKANEPLFANPPLAAPLVAALPSPAPTVPTGASSTLSVKNNATVTVNGVSTVVPNVPAAVASPYLSDKFFYTAQDQNPNPPIVPIPGPPIVTNNVDDPTSAGWFKMFEFFEVPTQSIGAYGPVAQGVNFDWLRQDLKPGLINLNLIIDEEAFLSVMGTQTSGYVQQLLNFNALTNNFVPHVATGQNLSTTGTLLTMSSYAMNNQGHIYAGSQSLKASFVQFLNSRHGGSIEDTTLNKPSFLFGFGSGAVGTPNTTVTATDGSNLRLSAERPFRSLSYPDINMTIMRPASLPPSPFSTPAWTDDADPTNGQQLPTAPAPYAAPGLVYDPGLKNPYLYPGYVSAFGVGGTNLPAASRIPPAIPARRLFQPPDLDRDSNANLTGTDLTTTSYYINHPTDNGTMPNLDGSKNTNPPSLITVPDFFLGGEGAGLGPTDQRQNPYFRTEMLQKVMNLTTVRTHQYAVWVTVGFFEVTHQGNLSMVTSNPGLAYDTLGPEIGLSAGKNVRHRGFFIVDRLKLTGFDPSSPGQFRDAVLYRRTIQ